MNRVSIYGGCLGDGFYGNGIVYMTVEWGSSECDIDELFLPRYGLREDPSIVVEFHMH
jgi:hypothetical protein